MPRAKIVGNIKDMKKLVSRTAIKSSPSRQDDADREQHDIGHREDTQHDGSAVSASSGSLTRTVLPQMLPESL